MRKRSNVLLVAAAAGVLQVSLSIASLANDGGAVEEPVRQSGETRWVPSLAITSGITVQQHEGSMNSVLFEDMGPTSIPLRGFRIGNDLAVSTFVGGALELMTPALPIPTRPRFFLSGEILPTFASDRAVAVEGDPGCLKGPEPDAVCAMDEDGSRTKAFGQDSLNGQGSVTQALVDTLVFGASLGVALPIQVAERPLRIKPSVGWINYEVGAHGMVVAGACDPRFRCTDVTVFGFTSPGYLREMVLMASATRRFNGIGPGLDIEMDTGRYGPLGVSLFLGGRAYHTLGQRKIAFGTSMSYADSLGMDLAVGNFEVEVDPWVYRAHAGIRFHWLGTPD